MFENMNLNARSHFLDEESSYPWGEAMDHSVLPVDCTQCEIPRDRPLF